MPDQSSASTEHALMQEITAPLATLPDDPVPAVADVEFPVVLRGYDRDSVDAYVQKTSQLVAELTTSRSPEAAVRRALERVGEEVSGILQRAHDTADKITAQSRSEAEDRLEAARQEAAQIVQRAEERVRELDAETDRIWAERHRIVEDTRELARELLTVTDSAADRFPAAEGASEGVEVLAPVAEDAVAPAGGEVVAPGGEGAVAPAGLDVVAPAGEDAASDEVAPAEPVPEETAGSDAEPTAVLPVVEPPEFYPAGEAPEHEGSSGHEGSSERGGFSAHEGSSGHQDTES
jgi:DivIVA domain-containing protein